MKILVINTGSSSIKYRLFDMRDQTELASGMLERIGEPSGRLTHQRAGAAPFVEEEPSPSHEAGMLRISGLLTGAGRGASDINAIGHRVVHGGEAFREAVVIDDRVAAVIRDNAPLAPLHNPPNLTGIQAARRLFPQTPQVAVFDTAFHQTIPPEAFLYALPYTLYEKHRIRRFGFHGTSHHYVAREAARFLGKPPLEANLITIHLGNGASVAAVARGRCVDTSMGLTPLEGLIMGTRCGDLDPSIPFFLSKNAGLPLDEIEDLLNRESGLKGLCGSNDMRDILGKKGEGDTRASLAVDMYAYRIKKYIGAYSAALGHVDAVVFTGGIGENAAEIRALCCNGLDNIGIRLDEEKNNVCSPDARSIASDGAPVAALVIPTNEELQIARETLAVLQAAGFCYNK